MRQAVLLVGAVMAMLATLAMSGVAHAAFPGENGKISFLRVDAKPYMMNPDGSNTEPIPGDFARLPTRLTWSPDGKKYAYFELDSSSPYATLYVANYDGSGKTQVVSGFRNPESIAWSPDGTQLAFQAWTDSKSHEIYVVNVDGSNLRNVSNNSAPEIRASWSPDGDKLAFVVQSTADVYTMNVDGSERTRVTDFNAGGEIYLDWAPDGDRIVFSVRGSEVTDTGIYTINEDGSNLTRVTNPTAGYDYNPVWSPDGSKIAFSRFISSNNDDVFTVNADGSGEVNLTNTGASYEFGVDWRVAIPPPDDTDGDGLSDGNDQCPSVPGPASNNGCPVPPPDADGDGVEDDNDGCPNEAGPASNDGCPLPPPDTVAPTGGVLINEGDKKTKSRDVVLTLQASDPAPNPTGVTHMRIMNAGGTWSAWMPYATSIDWTLGAGHGKKGQGKKTVYVQYRDAAGNLSDTASDAIVYRCEERPKETDSSSIHPST